MFAFVRGCESDMILVPQHDIILVLPCCGPGRGQEERGGEERGAAQELSPLQEDCESGATARAERVKTQEVKEVAGRE